MELFNSLSGFCEIHKKNVEVLMVKLKKTKGTDGALTPVRCQSASECPRSSFCRFVNPLTTRLPVVFDNEPAKTAKPAAAS